MAVVLLSMEAAILARWVLIDCLKVKVKVKVYVYSPDIPSSFNRLYINYPQVMELTHSHSSPRG